MSALELIFSRVLFNGTNIDVVQNELFLACTPFPRAPATESVVLAPLVPILQGEPKKQLPLSTAKVSGGRSRKPQSC